MYRQMEDAFFPLFPHMDCEDFLLNQKPFNQDGGTCFKSVFVNVCVFAYSWHFMCVKVISVCKCVCVCV